MPQLAPPSPPPLTPTCVPVPGETAWYTQRVTLDDTLRALDAAIAGAAPTFHAQLAPGLTDAGLAQVRAAYGALPEPAEAWYRWHAGSGDGFVPGTSWGLLVLGEILSERTRAPGELDRGTFAPLVTGRDGRLVYLVERPAQPLLVATYDRGEVASEMPFEMWLASLQATWRDEATLLRVPWIRWERSPMGGRGLYLPGGIRDDVRARLAAPPVRITDATYTDGSLPVRITIGDAPRWTEDEHHAALGLEIVITADGARALAVALADASNPLVRVPGLEDLRLGFGDR